MTKQPEKKQQIPKDVIRWSTPYTGQLFYQKADTIFQLTYVFCKRFLSKCGDHTVDEMLQAARWGKQNIVEGVKDENSSKEMQVELVNGARESLHELREDYEDFLHTRWLIRWTKGNPHYDAMLGFCKINNRAEDYIPYANRWTAEEFCNTLLTLCHITDKMMCCYLKRLEKQIAGQDDVKERMHAARTGYRQAQDELLEKLKVENEQLKAEVKRLEAELGMRKLEG